MHGRNAWADHVCDQADAGRHEAAILAGAGHAGRHFGAEDTFDPGDMQAALLEEPASQKAHDPAAAFRPDPRLQLEAPRRAGIEVVRRRVLQGFERRDQTIAQFVEPGPGAVGARGCRGLRRAPRSSQEGDLTLIWPRLTDMVAILRPQTVKSTL